MDLVEEQLAEYASLKQLWYFKDLVMEAFDKAVNEGPINPAYCMGFLHLLSEFPENTTPYWPDEVSTLGFIFYLDLRSSHCSFFPTKITERETYRP